jgi:hypothetical protein
VKNWKWKLCQVWPCISSFFNLPIGYSYEYIARFWIANKRHAVLNSVCAGAFRKVRSGLIFNGHPWLDVKQVWRLVTMLDQALKSSRIMCWRWRTTSVCTSGISWRAHCSWKVGEWGHPRRLHWWSKIPGDEEGGRTWHLDLAFVGRGLCSLPGRLSWWMHHKVLVISVQKTSRFPVPFASLLLLF